MANSRPDRLRAYSEVVDFGLIVGEGFGLPDAREEIATLSLTSEEAGVLQLLDEIVIEFLIDPTHWIDDYVLRDDPAQPLSRWWWHLGKLRAGVYPAELLPKHLQDIYRQNSIYKRLRANAVST